MSSEEQLLVGFSLGLVKKKKDFVCLKMSIFSFIIQLNIDFLDGQFSFSTLQILFHCLLVSIAIIEESVVELHS